MNNKRLVSLTVCLILATVPGISSLILADIASETDTKAQQHFEKANELRKLADYDAAITEYKKVISLSPKNKIAQDAQYWIGQSYYEAERFDAALSAFQKLLDEYPASTIIPSTKLMMERVQQAKKIKSLFEAAKKGDIEQVKMLIAKRSDVNAKDENENTPLHYAAQAGKMEVVQLLVEAGADLNCKDKDGQPPTRLAMENDHISVVELLVSKGADVSLHLAAYLGDLAKVKSFIESGIDINAKGQFGVTPLYLSLINRLHKDVAELLLDKGANPNTTAKNDATLLHQWAWGGDPDITKSLIEFLVSKGADVNALQGESRWTPLHSACHQGRGSVAKVLIDYGADVNAKDKWGHSPLHYAIQKGDLDTTKLLIAKGADVNAKDKGGYTPLIHVIWNKDRNMAELLVTNGAKLDVKDNDGWTAFHHAASQGSRDLIDFFTTKVADISSLHLAACAGDLARVKRALEQGTNLDAKDDIGWTPLYWAACTGQTEMAEFLVSKGAHINVRTKDGRTPLHQAAQVGDEKLVKLLVSKDADVSAKDKHGDTPIHGAASEEVVEILISKGANPNARGQHGRTPLDYAAWYGHTAVAEFLLHKNADINAIDNAYGTALHYAVLYNHPKVVELLLAKGANVNAKTKSGQTPLLGQTPLHGAAYTGRLQIAELLIAKGADINAKDNEGRTPLWWAKYRGRNETVELLRKHGAKE